MAAGPNVALQPDAPSQVKRTGQGMRYHQTCHETVPFRGAVPMITPNAE